MARNQKDYLADLLADGESASGVEPTRNRGTTLLSRESALARAASGEVRQVVQLLLDPARVRIWPGNARVYANLKPDNCGDLIDSIIAEGGQRVPAVVRRVEGDPAYDYEVIAGTRRHFAISWLRANSYPSMQFLAQVQQIDDEAAFRLADLENRARADVCDIERARNYAQALADHYGGKQARMAERLRLSKGWLSKMLTVAALPDIVVRAFASPADIKLKPAYPLAQAMNDPQTARAVVAVAAELARRQGDLRDAGAAPIPAPEILAGLLAATVDSPAESKPIYMSNSMTGRPLFEVRSANRQGVTLRLHNASGAGRRELHEAFDHLLNSLDQQGKGYQP